MVKPPKIEQALMDGTERTPLFSSALEHPQSLTIDKREQKLYWADQRLNRIEIADLGGGNRRVLVDGQVRLKSLFSDAHVQIKPDIIVMIVSFKEIREERPFN